MRNIQDFKKCSESCGIPALHIYAECFQECDGIRMAVIGGERFAAAVQREWKQVQITGNREQETESRKQD